MCSGQYLKHYKDLFVFFISDFPFLLLLQVMNFYLSLVMARSSAEAAGLKVYSFSTFFFPKLCGGGGVQVGGHAAVKRWTKAVDLFLYDLILVPLHLGVHWAMAVSQTSSCHTFLICCQVIPVTF